jgi:phospholipase C
MACFNHTALPVMSTLAQEFALFDEYHASVPGPTEVNRLYLHSATSHGDAYNDDAHLAIGYPQKTIFQKLTENGLTWGSYFTEGMI